MFGFPKSRIKGFFLGLLGVLFVVAGANHFLNPDFYRPMMPNYLPWHTELIYISGVFEILGGLGVLLKKTRKLAGYGLIALLLAVFPANIEMALHPEKFSHMASPNALYVRLPFQVLFILWVYWVIRPDSDA